MKAGFLRRKAAALFSVLAVILGISFLVYATSEEIEYVQAVTEEEEQKLASTEERISALEEAKSSSETYLSELSVQLEDLTGQLTATNEELAAKESELEDIQKEIDQLEYDAQEQYEAMKIRIQFLYENGTAAGTFISMFSADSFTEFLNRAENYSELNRYDREMLESYVTTLESIKDKQNDLLDEKEEIITIKNELSERQAMLQELYETAYNDMTAYISELDQAQAEQSAIVAQLQEQEALMNELLRRQYEEEAAAALAAEQAAQAALDAENIPDETWTEEEQQQTADDTVWQEEVYEENSPDGQTDTEDSVQEDVQETETASEPEETPVEETEEDSADGMTYLGNFMLTAYCPCAQCCGAYATGYTASGTLATEGVTVAMGGVDFGTKLCINGHIYTVEDRGTAYGHVDIFFSSHAAALQFGLQYADVYIVN